MSGQSPATVLYDSNGTALAVYNDTAVPVNTPAILFAGYDGYNAVSRYALMGSEGNLGTTDTSQNVVVLSNATVTASGSDIYSTQFFGMQEVNIIVNSTVLATGTTPTLTFTIQEVDPGNGTTVFGNSATTTTLTNANTPGVFTASLPITTSSAVRVSWTISGAGATFAGVYVTLTTKSTPSTQTINGTITATNNSVGTDGAAALGFDTQVGGKVTTSAPTYTTGNLNALSLTTLGGLRIDGVYVVGSTNGTAADVMNSGGYVTTAAPTYTTGQLNPLSLDTAGNLRTSVNNTVTVTGTTVNNQSVGADGGATLGFDTQVGGKVTTAAPAYSNNTLDALSLTQVGGLRIDGVYPQSTANASAADVMVSGGYTTTAAPTYTTGQLNALSLTTVGGLRIDGVYPTGTTTGNAPDAIEMGAITVAGPPTYTAGQLNALTTDVGGNLRVVTNKASTAATTSVAVTANAATTVLNSNTSRVFASIYNNTNKNIYIALGSTASTSNFSIVLLTQSYWEVPVDWTGSISEFSPSGASGSVLVTELTP